LSRYVSDAEAERAGRLPDVRSAEVTHGISGAASPRIDGAPTAFVLVLIAQIIVGVLTVRLE